MQLFRSEAMRSQDRLHGDIDLAPPTSWQTIAFGLVAAFGLAVVFLSIARYSRIAEATGVVESTRGTISVTSRLPGTVSRLLVEEGSAVERGRPLLVVEHRTPDEAGSLEDRRARAVADQTAALGDREPALRRGSAARIAALSTEAASAEADLAAAREQMQPQRDLVQAAREDLEKARTIALRGFVSQQDVRRREEALAGRVQTMSRLVQQASTARAAIARAGRQSEQERADLQSALAALGGERAQIAARAAADDVAARTIVTAPTSGTVAGLAVTPGARVDAGADLLTVVPAGGRLRVRLELPADAAASVAPGQSARLSLDAFPYQTYGTVPARIDRITPAAVRTGEDRKAFLAYATLGSTAVRSYGTARAVRPGMTVRARIRTMDRTLLQWLLDPLYAVAAR